MTITAVRPLPSAAVQRFTCEVERVRLRAVVTVALSGAAGAAEGAITLGSGSQHGVTAYMQGYLKSDAGPFATFAITEVGENTSRAFVDLTPDAVAQHQEVIIAPSHMPKPAAAHDVQATLLHVEVTQGGTLTPRSAQRREGRAALTGARRQRSRTK